MSSDTKTAHAPTPYRVSKSLPDSYTIMHGHGGVAGESGEKVTIIAETCGGTPEDLASAEFICRACNSYDGPTRTLRDYFAGQAMGGMYACQGFIMNELAKLVGSMENVREQIASYAYRQADAMLRER